MNTKKIDKNNKKVYYRDLTEGQMFTFTEDSLFGYEPRIKTQKGHFQFSNQMESIGEYNQEVILLDGELAFWEI